MPPHPSSAKRNGVADRGRKALEHWVSTHDWLPASEKITARRADSLRRDFLTAGFSQCLRKSLPAGRPTRLHTSNAQLGTINGPGPCGWPPEFQFLERRQYRHATAIRAVLRIVLEARPSASATDPKPGRRYGGCQCTSKRDLCCSVICLSVCLTDRPIETTLFRTVHTILTTHKDKRAAANIFIA